jgi:hypothetical protein
VFRHLGRRSIAGRKRKAAGLFALLLACVIGVGAYAFTASNTVTPHFAGGGAAGVTGYKVEGPSEYKWNDPGTKMIQVKFELNAEAKDVKVAYTKNATPPVKGDWADCGEAVAKVVTCNLTTTEAYGAEGIPNANAEEMAVVANQYGTAEVE